MHDVSQDHEYMSLALAEAHLAEKQDEVPVGAVVVVEDKVIAKGFNRTIVDCDPTAHAEMVAIRQAAKTINNHRLNQATVFVTLEPCAMSWGPYCRHASNDWFMVPVTLKPVQPAASWIYPIYLNSIMPLKLRKAFYKTSALKS